jgi:hypothetical protein
MESRTPDRQRHGTEGRRLLTETETSTYLGIPVGTLRRWRSVGMEIPYIKLGAGRNSSVRYDLRDLDLYIDDRRRYPSVTESFR